MMFQIVNKDDYSNDTFRIYLGECFIVVLTRLKMVESSNLRRGRETKQVWLSNVSKIILWHLSPLKKCADPQKISRDRNNIHWGSKYWNRVLITVSDSSCKPLGLELRDQRRHLIDLYPQLRYFLMITKARLCQALVI